MKRFSRSLGLAILAVAALAAGARADEPGRGAFGDHAGRGMGLGRLRRCLSNLDLTADQKSAIQQVLSDAKSTLQADIQAVRADHQKLATDIENGADKSVVGQDALTQHADAAKLRADMQAVRNQILSHLSTDQQNTVKGCFDAAGPARFGRRNG
ncbi:MAG TPA: hypothetical protein VIZ69_05515 [Thermoanaerobaculia bacterium]